MNEPSNNKSSDSSEIEGKRHHGISDDAVADMVAAFSRQHKRNEIFIDELYRWAARGIVGLLLYGLFHLTEMVIAGVGK